VCSDSWTAISGDVRLHAGRYIHFFDVRNGRLASVYQFMPGQNILDGNPPLKKYLIFDLIL
jgi:hypothetical protein